MNTTTTRSFPTGWFRVAWSDEVVAGEPPRPLRYFGQDLVIYRGASGRATVFNAHCAHLGAHLGYGGTVVGDDVVCPFHGWRWNNEGRNVEIPYQKRTISELCLMSWPVHEMDGIILVWHGLSDPSPVWYPDPIPELTDDGFLPLDAQTRMMWPGRRVKPENPLENLCDPADLKYVHGSGTVPEVVKVEAKGHRFRSVLEYPFGAGRPRTWLTPDGPVLGTLDAQASGLGLVVTRYRGIHETVQVFGVTPVDDDMSDVWSVVLPRTPSGAATPLVVDRIISHFNGQFDEDFPIWENMIVVEHPRLAQIEAKGMAMVRRWVAQFYQGGDGQEVTGSGTPLADDPVTV